MEGGELGLMNNRDLATFILLGVLLALLPVKRELRSALGQALKLMVSPRLGLPLLSFTGWTAFVISLAWQLGLWASGLTAATVLWFLFVGLAWFVNLGDASRDEGFFKRRLVETVGIGAAFEFFINLKVLSLPLELVLQVFLLVVVPLHVVARQKGEHKFVARLTTAVLIVVGLGLTTFTIFELVRDWDALNPWELAEQLLLPVWLTAFAVPCLYLIGLYAGYESLHLHLKFWNDSRRPRLRALAAVAVELKGSLVDINSFRGISARLAARTDSFQEARKAVQAFKHERARDIADRAEAKQRLVTYAGVPGVDRDGLQLDRREFAETKRALRWLATCHMGWYQREDLPNIYRSDLLSVIGDFSQQGLPGDHGIVMKVRNDGQAWHAYRTTPSGHVFGIGALGAPPSEWYYDGKEPPTSFPSRGTGWTSFMEPDRPEWGEERPID